MQLTTEDAAQLADVRQITIRQNIQHGNLKAEKHGRDWIINWEEFERWAQKRGVQLSPEVELVSREGKTSLLIIRGELALTIARAAERKNISVQKWFNEVVTRDLADK